MKISYRFAHEQRVLPEFCIDLQQAPQSRSGSASWTRLACNQCSNCPLPADADAYCPAAVDLEAVVAAFNEIISHERVLVTVETNERYVIKDCDAQDALSPLIGLIMANSACPILGRLRGMAKTHLPFQTQEETLFRFVASYYLSQLVLQQRGEAVDWSLQGLNTVFDELMLVNQAFKERVHSATKQDASMNAISALAMQALGAQLSLDDWYDELAGFAILA